jgi:hypothetical protein
MLSMSNKELELNTICKKYHKSAVLTGWQLSLRNKYLQMILNLSGSVKPCTRLRTSIYPYLYLDICCDGAKRCFGWLKNIDMKLAQRLSEKAGIAQN